MFEVMANCAATTDTDVDPHGWRLLTRRDSEQHLAAAQSLSDTAT
ncbi:hypothetical protein PV350_36075 [Streptomyces sp. PA03-6a]|nr:hypothetical protein [Streptomyces sp. PA03-6a]